MALNVKPLADRVVVEPAAAEEMSSGGIILPDTAQEKPQQGTIVATGFFNSILTQEPLSQWN